MKLESRQYGHSCQMHLNNLREKNLKILWRSKGRLFSNLLTSELLLNQNNDRLTSTFISHKPKYIKKVRLKS